MDGCCIRRKGRHKAKKIKKKHNALSVYALCSAIIILMCLIGVEWVIAMLLAVIIILLIK